MLRAPTWKMSLYFAINSIWLMSIPSEMTLRLCASAALRSMRRPSSPRPWNAYGELRGLNAPPRRIFAPARLTAAALACTCSSVSAEHGPAMTITSSPPIRTSPTLTTVSSGLNVRLARLYGSVMRSTSWTPSRMPINSGSILCAPTTPRTVRVTPDDRWTSMPSSIRRAMTASICASEARSFMTTTMPLLSNGRTEVFAGRARFASGPPRFIDDAFKDPDHGGVGPPGDLANVIRLRNAEPERDGQGADFPDALRHLLRAGRQRVPRAGDTEARDRVQKAAAKHRGPAQPVVGRRRTEKEDCINPPRGEHAPELVGLFDGKVEHEHTVHTGLLGAIRELFRAEPQNRVDIAEDHDRRRDLAANRTQ